MVGAGQVHPVQAKAESIVTFPVTFDKTFKMTVGASDVGLGAVLLQEGLDGFLPLSVKADAFSSPSSLPICPAARLVSCASLLEPHFA